MLRRLELFSERNKFFMSLQYFNFGIKFTWNALLFIFVQTFFIFKVSSSQRLALVQDNRKHR